MEAYSTLLLTSGPAIQHILENGNVVDLPGDVTFICEVSNPAMANSLGTVKFALIDLIRKKINSLGDPASINCITFVTAMHFGDHPWTGQFNYTDKKLELNLKLYRKLFSSAMEKFPSFKIQVLNLSHFEGYRRTDSHICYLCNAAHLIADAGGFSEQIKLIRNEFI